MTISEEGITIMSWRTNRLWILLALLFILLGIVIFSYHAHKEHMRRMARISRQRITFGCNNIFLAKFFDEGDTYRINDLKRLTNEKDYCYAPCFSPDGKTIVFFEIRRNVPTYLSAIYSVDVDGSNLRRLTPDDNFNYDTPVFTPDGQSIVFRSNRNASLKIGHFNYGLYIMHADGSGVKQLTYPQAWDGPVDVSPDGKSIAYVSKSISGPQQLYLMNIDGSNQHRLDYDNQDVYSAQFSPDGKQIYFSATGNGKFVIDIINLDGSDLKQLPVVLTDPNFRFTPYGDRIIYRASDTHFHTMQLDGSGQSIKPIGKIYIAPYLHYLDDGQVSFFPRHESRYINE